MRIPSSDSSMKGGTSGCSLGLIMTPLGWLPAAEATSSLAWCMSERIPVLVFGTSKSSLVGPVQPFWNRQTSRRRRTHKSTPVTVVCPGAAECSALREYDPGPELELLPRRLYGGHRFGRFGIAGKTGPRVGFAPWRFFFLCVCVLLAGGGGTSLLIHVHLHPWSGHFFSRISPKGLGIALPLFTAALRGPYGNIVPLLPVGRDQVWVGHSGGFSMILVGSNLPH